MRIYLRLGVVAVIVALTGVGCDKAPSRPFFAPSNAPAPGLTTPATPLATPEFPLAASTSPQPHTFFTFAGNPFICVAYSPDSNLVVAGAANRTQPGVSDFKIGNVQHGSVTRQMQANGNKVADVGFSPDGRSVVGAYALFGKPQGRITDVWAVNSGRVVRSLTGRLGTGYRALFPVTAADGRSSFGRSSLMRVGIAPWSETQPESVQVMVSDAPTGKTVRSLRLATRGAPPATFCLSRDGKVLAISFMVPVGPDSAHHYNRVAKVYDVVTGRLLLALALDKQRESGLAISPDSRILASGRWDGSVQLWDIQKRKLLRTLVPSSAGVESLVFSPDGASLAHAGWYNPTISVWNVATGTLQNRLQGHTAEVTGLAFAPNGTTLASGSGDGTVKLWRIR